jgi:hypothetical protein
MKGGPFVAETGMMEVPNTNYTKQDGFKTSLFGFRRDEVLQYINEVLQDNVTQQEYYKQQIRNLEEIIAEGEQEKNEIYSKAKEVATILRSEQERNKQLLESQEQILTEARLWQTKLNTKENEIALLRRDKTRLEERVTELETELDYARTNSARIEKTIAEAERTAANIIARAEEEALYFNKGILENAKDVDKSMTALKQELHETEKRIDIAFHSMKDATSEIESAMQRVDEQLASLAQKRQEVSWNEVAREADRSREPYRAIERTESAQIPQLSSPDLEEVAKKVTPTLQLLQDVLIESINKLLTK